MDFVCKLDMNDDMVSLFCGNLFIKRVLKYFQGHCSLLLVNFPYRIPKPLTYCLKIGNVIFGLDETLNSCKICRLKWIEHMDLNNNRRTTSSIGYVNYDIKLNKIMLIVDKCINICHILFRMDILNLDSCITSLESRGSSIINLKRE